MIIKQLDALKLQARKSKQPTAFLSLLISQINLIGKNDGDRETTDDEALRVLKKMIAANEETISVLDTGAQLDALQAEVDVMTPFLPQMVDEATVQAYIDELVSGGANNIGALMGGLKKKFGSTIDMKLANPLVRAALG